MSKAIELKMSVASLARDLGTNLDDWNRGCYSGTDIPMRRMSGDEIVTIRGTTAGAKIVTDETWIADRFGPLGARQIKRIIEADIRRLVER